MALGGPVLLLGAGVKAAIGGSIGFGALGAFSGSSYAGISNKQAEKQSETIKEIVEDNNRRKQQKQKRQRQRQRPSLLGVDSKDADEPLLTKSMVINAGLSPLSENNDKTKGVRRRVSFPIVSNSKESNKSKKQNQNDAMDDDDDMEPWDPN